MRVWRAPAHAGRPAPWATGGVVAGYPSKPLQGALLRGFRGLVLGVSEDGHELHEAEYTRTLEGFGLGNNQVT